MQSIKFSFIFRGPDFIIIFFFMDVLYRGNTGIPLLLVSSRFCMPRLGIVIESCFVSVCQVSITFRFCVISRYCFVCLWQVSIPFRLCMPRLGIVESRLGIVIKFRLVFSFLRESRSNG